MNHVALLLAREDRFNQGWKLVQNEHSLDQAFARWSVEVTKEEQIGEQLVFRTILPKVGLNAYDSQLQRRRW